MLESQMITSDSSNRWQLKQIRLSKRYICQDRQAKEEGEESVGSRIIESSIS